MKAFFVFLSLTLLPAYSLATDAEKLIAEKKSIKEEFASMTCAELKTGLPELSENTDVLKHLKQDSVDFELAIYNLKKVIEKSASCIKSTHLSEAESLTSQ